MSDLSIETKRKKSDLLYPFLGTGAGALIIAIAFFAPFVSSEHEHVNLIGVLSVYQELGGELGVVISIIVIIIAVFSLLSILFTLLKKPIAIIVFNCLTFLTVYLLSWDFQDRGVVRENSFSFGVGYYLYWIGCFVILFTSIWLISVKIRQKKMNKTNVEDRL